MNILLTSVGRRSYLVDYFKHALQGNGKVIATNSVSNTTGMFSADVAKVIPTGDDPNFITSLLSICKQYDVKILCSLHDWETPFIARHFDQFLSEGITPIMPKLNIVDICLDKFKSFQFALSIGVPSPLCFLEIEKALEAIEHKIIDYPLILKPRWGQGSIAMQKVNCIEELTFFYKLMHKNILNDTINYQAEDNQNKAILIQQFISGKEYGVDIVNDLKGEFATCFIKHKVAMRSGETDIAETVSVPEIEQMSRKISEATKHLGNLDADFFMADDGRILLLELNPRFGGGYPFSHIAGANIPAALISWAEGIEPNPDWLTVDIGIRSYKDITLVKK